MDDLVLNAPQALATVVQVAVETPRHAALGGLLHYASDALLEPGTLVRVPLGRRQVAGLVWDGDASPLPPPVAMRPVAAVATALPPLPADWRALLRFAADYYQRGLGELALAVLPPELRKLDTVAIGRRVDRLQRGLADGDAAPANATKPKKRARAAAVVSSSATTALLPADGDASASMTNTGPIDGAAPAPAPAATEPPAPTASSLTAPAIAPPLSAEQQTALAAFAADPRPALLFGVTGSGKTEVYLHAAERALKGGKQVLLLVPEINLTPQLEERVAARFPGRRLVSLHSALTPAARLRHWLQAHLGLADLVLGTRMAIFTPLPRLGLIVVDEEHDPSFKQQEGARYSARDLAVWRAAERGVPVLLGSATPSLETWHRAQQGRYQLLRLKERIGGGAMPRLRMVDMAPISPTVARAGAAGGAVERVLAPGLLTAVEERLARGEQSLLLLNRRGYAPVLHCTACGWKSGCPHCSAWRVFHKGDRTLRCHHCGLTERVPRACPDCGNLDISPIGRGTEKLQEQLAALLPQARVARIDADASRGAGVLQQQLQAVHDGEVDILVGTQMVAKGHDFRRVTLVAAVNPDGALFTSDFRAAERLFALLMQAAGRAGRDAEQAARSEMWVQSFDPGHPLYAALRAHDYEAFAAAQLAERRAAGLPPFAALALLRADARTSQAAADFLRDAAEAAAAHPGVTVYPPVPPPVAKVADVERMQMLVESPSRRVLQRMLAAWLPALDALRAPHKGLLRWAVDVDPLGI